MRRLGRIAAAAIVSALALGGAKVATADQGGTPNSKACHGEAVSILARQGETPADLTGGGLATAADVHRLIEQLCASGVPAAGAVQKVREAASQN